MSDEPRTLSDQLRREALTRAGVIGSIQDRLVNDKAFDEFWAIIQADRESLETERDSALAQLEEQKRKNVNLNRMLEMKKSSTALMCKSSEDLVAQLRAELARVGGDGKRLAWQPIETFDKSKMQFVLLHEDGAQRAALWVPGKGWETAKVEDIAAPTHWMELPESPAAMSASRDASK